MFHPISIPFGCVMLFNVVDLKDGVTVSDVELVLGDKKREQMIARK